MSATPTIEPEPVQQTASGAPGSRAAVIATLLSHVFSPALIGTLVLLSIPLRHPVATWSSALLATAFTIAIPWVALVAMRWSGHVSDIHVTRREQRWPLLLITLVSILIGLGILTLTAAPAVVVGEVGLFLLGLLLVGAVNLFWKLSIHAAVASFAALYCLLALPLGPHLAVLVVALVGWSRVRIAHHTPSQVLAGTVVGVLVSLGGLLPVFGV
ncbi:phosphatase PAP2 family protein [Zhihengliuella halotolerans]|uniref:phosphatase PAP2 family protein n=1 Tax=Zhihengliuella halotolerans TaxID=370736 RepID=UPI000C7FFED8|nr:phosphatase PAP2 family protein [Zhihengliuella halotolerans]